MVGLQQLVGADSRVDWSALEARILVCLEARSLVFVNCKALTVKWVGRLARMCTGCCFRTNSQEQFRSRLVNCPIWRVCMYTLSISLSRCAISCHQYNTIQQYSVTDRNNTCLRRWLYSNKLSGSVPETFANLTKLQFLYVLLLRMLRSKELTTD
jgi:hypothetical protein